MRLGAPFVLIPLLDLSSSTLALPTMYTSVEILVHIRLIPTNNPDSELFKTRHSDRRAIVEAQSVWLDAYAGQIRTQVG